MCRGPAESIIPSRPEGKGMQGNISFLASPGRSMPASACQKLVAIAQSNGHFRRALVFAESQDWWLRTVISKAFGLEPFFFSFSEFKLLHLHRI